MREKCLEQRQVSRAEGVSRGVRRTVEISNSSMRFAVERKTFSRVRHAILPEGESFIRRCNGLIAGGRELRTRRYTYACRDPSNHEGSENARHHGVRCNGTELNGVAIVPGITEGAKRVMLVRLPQQRAVLAVAREGGCAQPTAPVRT